MSTGRKRGLEKGRQPKASPAKKAGKSSLNTLQAEIQQLRGQITELQALRRLPDHTPCTSADFRNMVDHLKNACPLPKGHSCSFVREDLEETNTGHTTKDRRRFTITIDKKLSVYETEHVLIHEWAHVLAWRPHHPLAGDHGPDWGVWYSLAYRKYHGVE